ncbi:MAG: 4Fe-4S dicluster domain-containing protein [Elusimicrobiota bacterium]
MTLEDKLGLLTYKGDHQTHIKITDAKVCLNCPKKPCVTACPAGVYTWDDVQKKIIMAYENCVECGAARMMCPFYNIEWVPPRGGFGVAYKYG